jgi:hypothetical protein
MKFQIGDKAVWEHKRWEKKDSIFVRVTIIEESDKTFIIQFDGTIKKKRVDKSSTRLLRSKV